MTTAGKAQSIQDVLNEGNPNKLPDAVAQAKLGDSLWGLRKTLTGLTAAAAFDLTAIDDPDVAGAKLPAALSVGVLRVTAGAAAAGIRQISDAGDTPSASLATISDDGKTITFEGNVTAFIIHYIPKEDLSADFERA